MSDAVQHRAMPFVEHVRELRRRLIYCLYALGIGFAVGLVFYNHYVQFLIAPFGQELRTLGIAEGFVTKIRISAYAGLILSFPVHVYNILAFILPALTAKERRMLGWVLGGSVALMLAGGYLGYYQILPLSVRFLKEQNPANVTPDLQFQQNIGFVIRMVLAFIVLFQAPLVMLLLMAGNIVSRRRFLRLGRYFVVVIFVLSAILTPPDIVSQIGLAVPLLLLFYLTILVAWIVGIGNEEA